jgi:hypothetical protein
VPSEDAQEIADILDAVSGRVPVLLRSVLDQLYSPEAGRRMGQAIGAFYRELVEAGIPADRALQLAEDYSSPFSMVRSVMGGDELHAMGGHGPRPRHRAPDRPAPAPTGPLEQLWNNTGTSEDGNPGAADLDGVGWSLSAQALAACSLVPGGPVACAGFSFRWPEAGPGRPNNVAAEGQTVTLPARGGARRLGVLGLATHGPSAGVATLHYADGRQDPAALLLPDWTLHDGEGDPPAGVRVAARMPRRNGRDGPEDTEVMLCVAEIPLDPERVLQSITLPRKADQGMLHIFALALAD